MNRERTRQWCQYPFTSVEGSWISGTDPVITDRSMYLTAHETCHDRRLNGWTKVRKLRSALRDTRSVASELRLRTLLEWQQERNMGGPLLLYRRSWELRDSPVVHIYGRWNSTRHEWYDGNLLPTTPGSFTQVDVSPSSDITLFGMGGTAISRCRPQWSDFNGAVALGELREGLPRVVGSAFRKKGLSPKAGSEEYLNYEFGLKPLIRDINDAVSAFEQADRLWSQVKRDAGRRIRRRYVFPTSTSITRSRSAAKLSLYPALTSYFYDSYGYRYTTKTDEKRTWFSGAFKYHLPGGGSRWDRFRREAERWRICYGIDMSLQTLWNLTPWTWLADWFVDFQPLMGWLSTAHEDGMAMQYGYLMEHTVSVHEVTQPGVKLKTTGSYEPTLTQIRECKRRVGASPFGFGSTWDDFSPRQLAILTALGVSRADFLS